MNQNSIAYDCRDYTAEEILLLLYDIHPELEYDKRKRKRVYVGVTGDVKGRAQDHKITLDEIIFCAQTTHRRVAAKVERLAHDAGFYIGKVAHGGNGTNSRSLFVYAYVITKTTKE